MSEPAENLDLKSLDEALDTTHETPSGSAISGEEQSRHTMNLSSTLTAPPKDSSEVVSPASPEEQAAPEGTDADVSENRGESPLTQQSGRPQDGQRTSADQTTQSIKAMFPDLDKDTIQAVVVAEDGDFERAINTLLQMSDPTYVPPPPAKETSQTMQDEQLARSLAAQEQQSAIQENQRSRGPLPHSARGGSLGALFGGEHRETPSYDPTNLTYQPRVKRTTSGQTYPVRQERRPSPSNEAAPAVWPGPKEAKAWQEDINKFAETGFAKAASTFSALRQRSEQALQGVGQPRNQGPSTATQEAGAAASVGSMFSGWTQRKGPTSTMSPTISSGKGFDSDASPVGDNELAKVLARGRNPAQSGHSTGSPPSGSGRRSSVNNNDRYKKDSHTPGRPSGEHNNDQGDTLSWEDAGRTKDSKPFEPIKVHGEPSESAPRNAVSLMESSAGRGISSPKSLQAGSKSSHNDDDDDDDLEYVANPFEDED